MAKNTIPDDRWKRYEKGPPAVRMAFTNAETEALPQLLLDIENDWPIMEGLVANAHKTYEARHFEDRLRNMGAWYQWIEAYLHGEPIVERPKTVLQAFDELLEGGIQQGNLQYMVANTGVGKSMLTEEMFRKSIKELQYKQAYKTQIYTTNEYRYILGISP